MAGLIFATDFPLVHTYETSCSCDLLDYHLFYLQWDTAGDPRFTKIAEAYYKSAHAFLVAFSTTDKVLMT